MEEKNDHSNSGHFPTGTVDMRNFNVKWNKNIHFNNLVDLTCHIKPGELVMVVGSVGAGKTCLLYALLNELERVSGDCSLSGRTSYAPQEAWTFGGTIKENILLSSEYNVEKYAQVIKVCGLRRDLDLFPDGDQTLVGEKGYTLSGGQKARVTLARAVYNEADVYLLDDPLSAVDPAVANHIFSKCINGYLKSKTVILVTHQLQFLRHASRIIVLNEGRNIATGSYDELVESGVDFLSFLKTDENLNERKESLTSLSEMEVAEEKARQATHADAAARQADSKEEPNSTGAVHAAIYWAYFRAGGSLFLILGTLCVSIGTQVLYTYTDFWLSAWTEEYQHQGNVTNTKIATIENEMPNVIIYCVLMGVLLILAFLRTLSVFLLSLRASISLHNRIFKRLLRAPLAFFEDNPIGRILNRFTRDMGFVDQQIPSTIVELNQSMLIVTSVVVTGGIVNPYMVIPALVLFAISLPFRKIYLRTGRDVKRLDAATKSPVYSHISTTFDGLTTIRAFGLQDKFHEQYMNFIDDAVATRFITLMMELGIGFILDLFAQIYICAVSVILVVYPEGNSISS